MDKELYETKKNPIKCQHLNKQITEGEIQKAFNQNDAWLE